MENICTTFYDLERFGFLLSKVLKGNYDLEEQKGPLRGLRR